VSDHLPSNDCLKWSVNDLISEFYEALDKSEEASSENEADYRIKRATACAIAAVAVAIRDSRYNIHSV